MVYNTMNKQTVQISKCWETLFDVQFLSSLEHRVLSIAWKCVIVCRRLAFRKRRFDFHCNRMISLPHRLSLSTREQGQQGTRPWRDIFCRHIYFYTHMMEQRNAWDENRDKLIYKNVARWCKAIICSHSFIERAIIQFFSTKITGLALRLMATKR